MRKQIHGGDIYSQRVELDFSANINPLGMPPSVREAACEGVALSESYPDVLCRELRQAISETEGVSAEQIICGSGAAELIFALSYGMAPKHALLTTPGFAEYELALERAGCRIRYYPCQREKGFAIGEDYLEELTGDLDMVFLCNPNNPTGIPIAQSLLEKAADLCQERDILLVVDECFIPLMPGGQDQSLVRLLADHPRLFILRAFTKLYAMAGLRLGYGFCRDTAVLERMREMLQPWNVSIPAQKAGKAAMALRDYPEKTRAYVGRELAFMKEGFRRLGLTFWDSAANYLFFEGPADLQEKCLREGILIRSCSNYRGLGEGYFRVAVRTRKENERLLETLSRILHEPEGGEG